MSTETRGVRSLASGVFLTLLTFGFVETAMAQAMPSSDGVGAAPDSILLRQSGPPWWFHSQPAPEPASLQRRAPSAAEKLVVERATQLLAQRSAKAIVLMDGDVVVHVKYKPPATEQSLFWSASLGKTVTSMAVGQAICAGKLSYDDKAEKLIPGLRGKALGRATARDLLRMTSGAADPNADSTIWAPEQARAVEEGYLSIADVVSEDRVAGAAKGVFSDYKPGEHFSYKSTDPFVLGLMVSKAVGMPYAEWLQSSVLNPMGASQTGLLDLDHQGNALAAAGIRLRLEDWMRFASWVKRVSQGQGCLTDYVRAAMSRQVYNAGPTSSRKFGATFDGYGYLFWVDNRVAPRTAFAAGWGGQRISWDTQSNRMVLAFSNADDWMPDLYALIRDWNQLGH